jgi:hypothetical protein
LAAYFLSERTQTCQLASFTSRLVLFIYRGNAMVYLSWANIQLRFEVQTSTDSDMEKLKLYDKALNEIDAYRKPAHSWEWENEIEKENTLDFIEKEFKRNIYINEQKL